MKKLIPLIILAGALAYAGSSKTAVVSSAAQGSEPTSLTAGLPVVDGTGASALELRRVVVTVTQGNDAGPETLDLNTIRLRAWKFTATNVLPDAGTLFRWSRMPELDYAYDSDAGAAATGYLLHNSGLSASIGIPPMGAGSRLTWTQHGVLGVDGGTVDTQVTMEGRYLPELHPYP